MLRSLLVLIVFFVLTSATFAIWVAVPLEILVDEAEIIVEGKVARVQNGGFAIGARQYDVAVVEVADVLRALPQANKPKEVLIAQPAAAGLAVSTDIRFKPGQQGVWLLAKDPERKVYWAKHPSQFQTEKAKIAEVVKARAKVEGGKPVNGLVARAELVEHKTAKGGGSFEVRFSLKNVAEKPITICDYVGNRPLQVVWEAPMGKMLKSSHYDWLAMADIVALDKSHFVTIPPGGVRFIGPRSKEFGILFEPAGQNPTRTNAAQPGRHKVTVSYANNEDGKRFELQDVSTGTVTANEVVFTVK